MTPDEIAKNCFLDAHDAKTEVGLWWIAQCVNERLGITDPEENKKTSLQIVKTLMANNVMPGDLGTKPGGFKFWHGTPDELFVRVKSIWPKNGIPHLGDPCWFVYRPPT